MRPDRRAKIRATVRNYLLGAITRRSARPHLRQRDASLLGNESRSNAECRDCGAWVAWRAKPCGLVTRDSDRARVGDVVGNPQPLRLEQTVTAGICAAGRRNFRKRHAWERGSALAIAPIISTDTNILFASQHIKKHSRMIALRWENSPRFIFLHLRLLHPPSFSSEDG